MRQPHHSLVRLFSDFPITACSVVRGTVLKYFGSKQELYKNKGTSPENGQGRAVVQRSVMEGDHHI